MDIYTNPLKNTYVTGITKSFIMPTDSGGIPAVAVSKRTSVFISSTYTILMILIFMIGWNLILASIMAFWPTDCDPNRVTALVALWNSGESMNASLLMISYCKRMWRYSSENKKKGASSNTAAQGDPQHPPPASTDEVEKADPGQVSTRLLPEQASNPKSPRSNMWWGLLFLLIALAMSAGNIISGLFVPVQLTMGNVAPAAKDAIFYPDVPGLSKTDDNGAGAAKLDSLRAPSTLRALGSIEASDVTVRNRVHLEELATPRGQHASDWAGLRYNYDVTAVDMGLQTDPNLKLMVTGSCFTDYTWLQNSTDEEDTYKLFGGNDKHVVKPQPDLNIPPMATFFIGQEMGEGSSNFTYAIIPSTAGLYSYSSGQDPWYSTKKAPDSAGLPFQVLAGRPALSCWEVRRWHLNGKDVAATQLGALPGLKLNELWKKTVFPQEFAVPRLVTLGRTAGASALKSASYATAPAFVLDATQSSILNDLERLVLASWVNSRNVVIDTTTYKAPGGMTNKAKGPRGSVEAASAKFVLQSGDVVTLSSRILISVPVILIILFILEMIMGRVLKSHDLKQKAIFKGERNGTSLQAAQLLRRLDHGIYERSWICPKGLIPLQFPPQEPKPEE
ncbi:hypothetical protein B9Z19DRAFT_1050578 [Tuber borchii]|uniref:Uncharacterized protein n=1 Tax=Tuber borchii TaxID=42251 RepID=A0A2T6ZP37_TUBBO|nr:hypothetical protein B9Z19DRAFT_1050578 [Tuber borchii]